eukprot:738388_1
MDGGLDIWDYHYKQNEPVYPMRVGEVGLMSIAVQEAGSLVAVGDVDGTVTLVQLSSSLVYPHSTEKATVSAMFERETKREKNLDTQREKKKKEVERAKREAG